MSSLPNEILRDLTNFLDNDDITDRMLLSRNFNAVVTPRLLKIDQEMATMNQSIKSFMPSPTPDHTDNEWISQLDLKRFEPIGSEAKNRMEEAFGYKYYLPHIIRDAKKYSNFGMLKHVKKRMSLERFKDKTFMRILGALLATPEFLEEYNVSDNYARTITSFANKYYGPFNDVVRMWAFYDPGYSLKHFKIYYE
ncbi:hypothetical protein Ddc_14775 [Ditylenchus destructor]|nr:hypothetical protein Ddc_14775 [Ditylenchus destructor]